MKNTYVKALYQGGDIELFRQGFHPEFNMYIYYKGELEKRSLDQWIDKLKKKRAKAASSNKTTKKIYTHEFETIEVTGQTAFVKLATFHEDKKLTTDYFTLYKIEGEWKIMTKLFSFH